MLQTNTMTDTNLSNSASIQPAVPAEKEPAVQGVIWNKKEEAVAHRTPDSRFKIQFEQADIFTLPMDYDNRADTRRFAEDIVQALYANISASDMVAIIEVLGERLIAWGHETPTSNRLVMAEKAVQTLQALLAHPQKTKT